MKTVTVIIPVFCNEQSIKELGADLLKLENSLLKVKLSLQVIFVDDGSTDRSLLSLFIIKKNLKSASIVKLTRNFGVVNAIKCAFPLIKGDCLTILAADLQEDPNLIRLMAEKWLEGNELIICERSEREDPFFSKAFSKLFYFFINLFVFKDYPKTGFDLFMLDKKYIPYLQNSSKSAYYSMLIHWMGLKPYSIKYKRKKRKYGKSKWSVSKKINLMYDIILSFSSFPIKFISAIGIATSIMSLMYGSFIIYNSLKGNISVPGYATITTLISFLLGLVIFMLGIIGEYIWRIYDENNKRPQGIIEDIFR
jgi:polyisoprenyl-phosphate glycosyltransferase